MLRTHIEIRGARTHNLSGVDADVPIGGMTVVTGISGSGKSSFAIDTVYAEAQRRYIESLSTYARQFLERVERPDFERIDFIPPAIAIGQTSAPKTARANVGSMTQVSDLLSLLFASASEPHCPNGHGRIQRQAPSTVRSELSEHHAGERAMVVAPVPAGNRTRLVRDGYTRALDEMGQIQDVREMSGSEYRVVIDRFVIKDGARVAEAVTQAFRLGEGHADIVFVDRDETLTVHESLTCSTCSTVVRPREARLFSRSSPIGACDTCQGFGRVPIIDPEKVVPDATLTLLQDAIAPWSTPTRAKYKRRFHEMAKEDGLRLSTPWQDLSQKEKDLVWSAVRRFFARLEKKRYKMSARILIARYRGYETCSTCGASGLKADALNHKIAGVDIAEAHRMTVDELWAWVEQRELPVEVHPLRTRMLRRLSILTEVGLGYLTLDREGRTLSAGEARRAHLSCALGAGVTGTLYVLDEPSIGLHSRDTERLTKLLARLADAGNTVMVVEHDPDIILAADHVIELGPDAGRAGGELVFAGAPAELLKAKTKTAQAVSGTFDGMQLDRGEDEGAIKVIGARARTLRDLNLRFIRGALNVISGVSGSGKSTLLHHVLARNLPRALQGAHLDDAALTELRGLEGLDAVHLVDTSPLAKSTRSIPATYLDAWTPIRAALASSPEAKAGGLTPGDFSFNSKGGRCETCKGLGTVTVDMQFLADVTVRCEVCDGRRFSERVLGAKWRGLDVYEVLGLTVDEAHQKFESSPSVRRKLAPLREVGLGYVTLGQATSTLSGGEAQRLKLAAHLTSKRGGPAVFLLDEPTTGLHIFDVEKLLRAFDALLRTGATLIVVEHNLEIIRHAHHLVDLGPEGGLAGGDLVVSGSIFDVMGEPASHTGRALANYLSAGSR